MNFYFNILRYICLALEKHASMARYHFIIFIGFAYFSDHFYYCYIFHFIDRNIGLSRLTRWSRITIITLHDILLSR